MNHLLARLYDRQGTLENDILRKMALVERVKALVLCGLADADASAKVAAPVVVHISELRRDLAKVEAAIARNLPLGTQVA